MLMTINGNLDFLQKAITGDESWVYDYEFETKDQSSQLKRPEELRSENAPSPVKWIDFAHCFIRLQWRGASWTQPQDRTFNKEYYIEVMRRLREAIRQKRT